MDAFRNLLPVLSVLKFYSLCHVYYRLSVLTMNIGTRSISPQVTCSGDYKHGAKNEVKADESMAVRDDPYDVEKCVQWIRANALKKVCLQFPDSLLPDSVDVALRIEKVTGRKVYILGDTTCGSCCVDEIAAQHINADGIIHFGHACLNPTVRLPVLYILPNRQLCATELVDEFRRVFSDRTKKILFFYDVAYAHKIEYIYNLLKPTYKHLVLSKLNCTSNVEYTDAKTAPVSVVLGRSYTLENGYNVQDYEGFFLGDGKTFSLLAMGISVKKWYSFTNGTINESEALSTPWLKRRRFLIEKLKDAKVVGIVAATLSIKEYLVAINMVKKVLKQKNKKSYILSVGKINPAKLANFPEIDVFVVIACPEHEVFDSRDFLRPILTPYEVELAFNVAREFSPQYLMDFRQILPGGSQYVDFTPSTDADVSLVTSNVRNCEDEDALCTDKMTALEIRSSGTIAIGKAGAQYLQERSWKGVEQRLGEDPVQPAEIGRSGLAWEYTNELLKTDKHTTQAQ